MLFKYIKKRKIIGNVIKRVRFIDSLLGNDREVSKLQQAVTE
jgi:hypothetical protein